MLAIPFWKTKLIVCRSWFRNIINHSHVTEDWNLSESHRKSLLNSKFYVNLQGGYGKCQTFVKNKCHTSRWSSSKLLIVFFLIYTSSVKITQEDINTASPEEKRTWYFWRTWLIDNYMLPIANIGEDQAADIATSWNRYLKSWYR
jgi:hypothetical protein